jgi:hypothetical protein
MRLALPSGTEAQLQRLEDVLDRGAPKIEADALIVSADALRAQGAMERLARKLPASRCRVVAILGPDAERLHDALDEFLADDGAAVDSLPTTTWHSDEAAEDVLCMVEQMVLSSASGPGPRTILVLPASTHEPTDVRDLVDMLDADLRGSA